MSTTLSPPPSLRRTPSPKASHVLHRPGAGRADGKPSFDARADARTRGARSDPWRRSSAAAKVSTKLDLLGNLMERVDTLIIGGGMANTFLFAQAARTARRPGSARRNSPTPRGLFWARRRPPAAPNSPPGRRDRQRCIRARVPSRFVDVDHVAEDEMNSSISSPEPVLAVDEEALAKAKPLVLEERPAQGFRVAAVRRCHDADRQDGGAADLRDVKADRLAGGGDTVSAVNAARASPNKLNGVHDGGRRFSSNGWRQGSARRRGATTHEIETGSALRAYRSAETIAAHSSSSDPRATEACRRRYQ